MTERELLKTQTKKLLRSLLVSSKKDIPVENLNREYKELVCESIPFKKLGYCSLDELLR